MSKDTTKLANRIVTEKAILDKQTGVDGTSGYMVNLIAVVGWLQWYEGSKKTATENAIKDLSTLLEDGTISLSDSWEKDNL